MNYPFHFFLPSSLENTLVTKKQKQPPLQHQKKKKLQFSHVSN